jgi:spore germination cell wall hydrolase CwlJ-like protein
MTILQRAATLAVMTFALAGLTGISTPGIAAGQTIAPRLTPAVIVQEARPASSLADPAVVPSDSVTTPAPAVATPDAAVPDSYDTLAAAVAAQNVADADEATRCLAGAIYFEAKGEPIAGQLAVAEVVMNRAGSGRFPPDVCSVIKQRGQFSFVHGGEIPSIDTDRPSYRTALSVAKVAMAKAWQSAAPRALFFHARREAAGARMVRVAAIGNHVFYR